VTDSQRTLAYERLLLVSSRLPASQLEPLGQRKAIVLSNRDKMFDKLKRLVRGNPKKEEDLNIPEIPWVPPEKNPWHVPLLDVRPVTHQMLSTSKDPECAQNAISYSQDDGTGFANDVPEVSRVLSSELRYRFDRVLAPGALFIPAVMEHKWALYYHGGRILFIRSWTRKVMATAEVECGNEGIARVASVRGAFVSENEESEFTLRALDYLIRSHALGIVFPAPLPLEFEKSPKMSAMWCMNMFGKLAAFATPHRIDAGIPDKPLRTHSLMHIAVARGDTEATDKFLKAGLPVDLLAADGLAPLHWAFVRKDTAMASFLMDRGSPVDVRSAEGATPLMTEVQSGDLIKIKFLLDASADVNAVDSRGFNSLHRAAEKGNVNVVKLLLNHNARTDITAQGHTALSFAEQRGHIEVVKLLKQI
jgi:hypothetical protein